jgi:uncharacterized damage-inducible protein DinB
MKTLMGICVLAAVPLLAAGDGAMNDSERAFLLDQLEQSKKNMLASIQGLNDAQWKFKPAPNVWSVAECAEHIVLSEDFIFNSARGILKTPAVDRMPSSNAEVDKKFVVGVEDRSHKATAPEPIVPSGKINSPADAAREFIARRDKTIEYVKTTTDDLRIHVADGPAGKMDAYQFLILLAAHSTRHTAQIREVEANAGFPKASASN